MPMPTRDALLILGISMNSLCNACTIVLAGKKATADGSSLLFHTDDCAECDFRLGRTLPQSTSAPRPVLRFHSTYPREVSDRSDTYLPANLDEALPSDLLSSWRTDEWRQNQTLGQLVSLDTATAAALGVVTPGQRTYGTLEGLYSIVNTKQVAIVESTGSTPALLWSKARPSVKAGQPFATKRDGALWDISALTKVALAYCPTARCAVDLMGYLAATEGFYGGDGTDASRPAGGETLFVSDPQESWTFEVSALPPDVAVAAGVEGAATSRGYSAVWVAKRVPDDHFTYVANRFTIRDVLEVPRDESSQTTLACRGETFRHSTNLFAIAEHLTRLNRNPLPSEMIEAEQLGVRQANANRQLRVVDWAVHFGGVDPKMAAYTNDRVWRVLSLLAPEQKWAWPPTTPMATREYPWSARPSRALSRHDLMALIRDTYRGADVPQLDLSRGPAAGPWGDPSRYDTVPSVGAGGGFPRAISMFRTSHSYVVEIGRRRGDVLGARVWASQGAPHAAIYTPIHVLPASADDASAVAEMPRSLTRGSLHRADAVGGSAADSSVFWRSTLVNNWARAVGFDMAYETIRAAQQQAEAEAEAAADEAEDQAAAADGAAARAAVLAAADSTLAARSAQRHQELIVALMTRLHDGYKMQTQTTTLSVEKLFYPRWWLERVGYYNRGLPPSAAHAQHDAPTTAEATQTAQAADVRSHAHASAAPAAPSGPAPASAFSAATFTAAPAIRLATVPDTFPEPPAESPPARAPVALIACSALLVSAGLALGVKAGVHLYRNGRPQWRSVSLSGRWPEHLSAPLAEDGHVYHSAA